MSPDVGGPCKRCERFLPIMKFCKIYHCYVEPNGPDYACAKFAPRRS